MPKHKLFIFIICAILLAVAAINFFSHVYGYRNDIFAKFDGKYWEKRYQESQWFVKNSKNSIGDDGLYAYAGYAYVQGKDPTLLNAELPPFGKYLVGIFEVDTGIMGAFSVFFTGLSLILMFFFTKSVFKSSLIASISTVLFSFEPLLIEQMRAPYLDTLYLCLFLLTTLCFIKQKYVLSGLFLGLFMSVKPPFFAGLIIGVYFLGLLYERKKIIQPLVKIIIPSIIVYVATYFRMFMLGKTIINFLQVQKYIVHFYSVGAKAVLGAVFPMLIQGKWPTWFGPTLSVGEWTILWPLSLLGFAFAVFVFIKAKNKERGILFEYIWVLGYLIFLIVTPLFPRYLLLLLPFMYNLSIWAFLKSISYKYSWVLSS